MLLIQLVEMLDLDSRCCKFDSYVAHHAQLAQLVEARDLNPLKYEFDSHIVYQISCRFVVWYPEVKQTNLKIYLLSGILESIKGNTNKITPKHSAKDLTL